MLGSSSKINLSGNSQTISGAFTSASGSAIASTIHSSTSVDKLTVSGAASLNSNTKLSLTISGITPGSSYTIIDGGSGSSINAITNSNINVNGSGTNRFGKYIFKTAVSGNDLLLNSSLASITSSNGNRGAVYDNITNANAGSGGGLYTMQEYIFGDASDEAKNAALDSAMPQVDNASNRSIFNSANTSFDLSSNRMQSLYSAGSGIASGDEVIEKHRNFWIQAFGSNVNQGNTSTSEGYKSDIRGFAFGTDKEISNESLIGISGSYSNSSVKSRSALKQTRINSYQINGYSGYHYKNYFINALAGFVWNEYESNRYIPVTTSTASAKYHGQTYIARAEAGMMQKLKKGFILTPTATITAAHNRVDDFSEDGAGTLNLSVRNKSTDFFEGRAGIALKKNFYVSNYAVVPEIFASYGYDFAGSKQRTNSNFVGQTSNFNSSASNIARGSFKSGISTKIYGNETLSFNLDYVFEMRQNYHANSAALKSSYKF
jgi:outer membrane autotransporter protein